MNVVSREEFETRVAMSGLNKRKQELLRFVPEEIADWEQRDFLVVFDKPRHMGVILYDTV